MNNYRTTKFVVLTTSLFVFWVLEFPPNFVNFLIGWQFDYRWQWLISLSRVIKVFFFFVNTDSLLYLQSLII